MNETTGLIEWLPSGHQDKADLGVVIVTWNVKELVLENLRTLFQSQGSIKAEVIVVDNASSDGTIEAIQSAFPHVHVIANKKNEGFAKANNQAIASLLTRHILLLNPDMTVEPTALQKTVEYLDAHPDVGVMGARLSHPDGSVIHSVRRFPDLWSQICIFLKIAKVFPFVLNNYLWHDFDYTKEQSVDSVRGSYFAINRTALDRFPGLDERYFIWFEEVDYCKQVTVGGMKVVYMPTIRAQDLVGRSFAKQNIFWKQWRVARSMFQYLHKWK